MSRLEYRDSKKPRSVCVYTIAQESKYIIIKNVPKLGLSKELIEKCNSFGTVLRHERLTEEEFKESYLIEYDKIQSAMMAKRKMDDKPFFCELIQVYYAPEYESLEDIRVKFQDRVNSVQQRLLSLNKKPFKRKPYSIEPQPQPQPKPQLEKRNTIQSQSHQIPDTSLTNQFVNKRRRI